MSPLVIDLVLWALLLIGVGFGLIGLIGLLLFPDTRSRMYTAVRATMISAGSVGLAALIYGLNAMQTFGGDQYLTLILHTVLLLILVGLGNTVISRLILENTHHSPAGQILLEKSAEDKDKK